MKANYAQRHNDRKEEIRERQFYDRAIKDVHNLEHKPLKIRTTNPFLKEMFPEI
jgi:hypothetical protein